MSQDIVPGPTEAALAATVQVVRRTVTWDQFVDDGGNGIVTDIITIPAGSLIYLPAVVVLTPFNDSFGPSIDLIVGTAADNSKTIADADPTGAGGTQIGTLQTASNNRYPASGPFPLYAPVDTPLSFMLNSWGNDGSAGEAEMVLSIIYP